MLFLISSLLLASASASCPYGQDFGKWWTTNCSKKPGTVCCSACPGGIRCDANGQINEITLAANQLSGQIPPELGALVGLTRLMLNSNLLNGTIPIELGNLKNLKDLELSENNFSCSVRDYSGWVQMPGGTTDWKYWGADGMTNCKTPMTWDNSHFIGQLGCVAGCDGARSFEAKIMSCTEGYINLHDSSVLSVKANYCNETVLIGDIGLYNTKTEFGYLMLDMTNVGTKNEHLGGYVINTTTVNEIIEYSISASRSPYSKDTLWAPIK